MDEFLPNFDISFHEQDSEKLSLTGMREFVLNESLGTFLKPPKEMLSAAKLGYMENCERYLLSL